MASIPAISDQHMPRALMIATATDWQGTARTPAALAKAGFAAYLLAPQASYARLSEHTREHYLLRHPATLAIQATTIATVVDHVTPRLLLPCDDGAFGLLQEIARAPLAGVPSAVYAKLRDLIALSLGDPAFFATSVDKLQFARAAQQAGLRVPPGVVTTSIDDAAAFAAEHGYPVVLKRSFSFGGKGVAICAGLTELLQEFAPLQAGGAHAAHAGSTPLLVQKHVPGVTWYVAATAWRGELLCAYAVEKVEGFPRGAATVVRYFDHPGMIEATAALARAFRASGLFAPEFVAVDRDSPAWLIEVNRRPVGGTHRGAAINVDQLRALRAALDGEPPPTRARLAPGEEHVFVHFPLEWMRDPESPYLCYHRSDAPIDEPRLYAALFNLGWKVNQLRRPP
jgi:carbamoyl-phosphate synthase L subunit-like protein